MFFSITKYLIKKSKINKIITNVLNFTHRVHMNEVNCLCFQPSVRAEISCKARRSVLICISFGLKHVHSFLPIGRCTKSPSSFLAPSFPVFQQHLTTENKTTRSINHFFNYFC